MKTEAEIEAMSHLGSDEPGTTKGEREPPEAGRDEEGFFPRACRVGHGPIDPRFQTSGLQNCERTNFCWKPPSLWSFVTAALGKKYRGF